MKIKQISKGIPNQDVTTDSDPPKSVSSGNQHIATEPRQSDQELSQITENNAVDDDSTAPISIDSTNQTQVYHHCSPNGTHERKQINQASLHVKALLLLRAVGFTGRGDANMAYLLGRTVLTHTLTQKPVINS